MSEIRRAPDGEYMDDLRREITRYFGREEQPSVKDLVETDGFDVPEKERAVKFYSGKTWADVLRHLRGLKDDPVFGAAYYLEEWAVLNKGPLSYYLRAHLEFLLDNLSSAQPDEEFVFYFLGQLYQVIYMHRGSPFTLEQTSFLRRLAGDIARIAENGERFEYFGADIQDSVKEFLAELDKYFVGD